MGVCSARLPSVGNIPALDFDLGGLFDVTSLVGWNYSVAGNAAKDITAEFFRDGSPVGSPVSLTIPVGTGSAHELFLGDIFRAVTVRLTITDNFLEGDPGGDRGGLAEVRFIGTFIPEPATLGLLGLRRRKRA